MLFEEIEYFEYCKKALPEEQLRSSLWMPMFRSFFKDHQSIIIVPEFKIKALVRSYKVDHRVDIVAILRSEFACEAPFLLVEVAAYSTANGEQHKDFQKLVFEMKVSKMVLVCFSFKRLVLIGFVGTFKIRN